MADERHLKLLHAIIAQGTHAEELWRSWRWSNPEITLDLSSADFTGAAFAAPVLWGLDFSNANLTRANFNGASLVAMKLNGANLAEADLRAANLTNSDLIGANLVDANLHHANLNGARLINANLTNVIFGRTIFAFTHFWGATGLETCRHHAPSAIDQDLLISYPFPESFLRGCGVAENLIEYLPLLRDQ